MKRHNKILTAIIIIFCITLFIKNEYQDYQGNKRIDNQIKSEVRDKIIKEHITTQGIVGNGSSINYKDNTVTQLQ